MLNAYFVKFKPGSLNKMYTKPGMLYQVYFLKPKQTGTVIKEKKIMQR